MKAMINSENMEKWTTIILITDLSYLTQLDATEHGIPYKMTEKSIDVILYSIQSTQIIVALEMHKIIW